MKRSLFLSLLAATMFSVAARAEDVAWIDIWEQIEQPAVSCQSATIASGSQEMFDTWWSWTSIGSFTNFGLLILVR